MEKWEISLPPRHKIGLLRILNVEAVLLGHLRRLLYQKADKLIFQPICPLWLPKQGNVEHLVGLP